MWLSGGACVYQALSSILPHLPPKETRQKEMDIHQSQGPFLSKLVISVTVVKASQHGYHQESEKATNRKEQIYI